MNTDNRVIVSGCGPVGAVMTLALVRKGIPVTLIEQLPDAAEDQRAATIHTPTVEMLVDLGLETEMFSDAPSGGMQAPLFHFRDRATGELIAVFDISLLKGEVPYPYVVQWEQYKLVHAALPHIKASGLGEVRFSTKLVGLTQSADYVEATITNAAGENETLRGKYLIGTDGGSSAVRQARRHRVRRLHLAGALHQDRHQFRFRHDREGVLHAQLFLRSGRMAQPVQGQGLRSARNLARRAAHSGLGNRRAGAEHGQHPAPPAAHPSQERRL